MDCCPGVIRISSLRFFSIEISENANSCLKNIRSVLPEFVIKFLNNTVVGIFPVPKVLAETSFVHRNKLPYDLLMQFLHV